MSDFVDSTALSEVHKSLANNNRNKPMYCLHLEDLTSKSKSKYFIVLDLNESNTIISFKGFEVNKKVDDVNKESLLGLAGEKEIGSYKVPWSRVVTLKTLGYKYNKKG